MSRRIGKPTIFIGENKGADQLRNHCEADQRLCFRHTDTTFPLLSKSKVPSLHSHCVTEQAGLCRTWPRGYKTFFMLSSAESKIYPAHKC